MTRTCMTCRFWDSRAGKEGLCRANPPVILSDLIGNPTTDVYDATVWPETSPEDWCGEHEEKR